MNKQDVYSAELQQYINSNVSGGKKTKTKTKTKTNTKHKSKKEIKYYKITKINWKQLYKNLKKTQISTLDRIINNAKDDLARNNIDLFIVPLPLSKTGHYFIDFAWDIVKEKYDQDWLDKSFIILVLKLQIDGTLLVDKDGQICMQHQLLGKKKKEAAMSIFKQLFGNKLEWKGTAAKAICIDLN